jgi:hypothetical protein
MDPVDDPGRWGAAHLEEAFFARENAALLADLRKKTSAESRKDRLREVVKIKDEAFLARLDTLGLEPQTVLAVVLVPLVFVAWADGKLEDKEREAILAASRDRGVAAEQTARRLLASALEHPPDPKLLVRWKSFAKRLWGRFTADERWQMRKHVLGSAREVAEAAGGMLGLTSKISTAERKVLEEMERVLD